MTTAARDLAKTQENVGVSAYLLAHGPKTGFLKPSEVSDPYLRQGSHPDIVERIFKGLGQNLPEDALGVIFGTPGIYEPSSGVILALALGTSYALRIPSAERKSDQQTTILYSARTSLEKLLDLALFGPDWIVGRFKAEELAWCQQCFSDFAAANNLI